MAGMGYCGLVSRAVCLGLGVFEADGSWVGLDRAYSGLASRASRESGKGRSSLDVVLVNVRSDGREVEIPMRWKHAVLGRREDCQVRIPLANVSRQHCEIVVEADGLLVRDLGSSNGTFVNGDRIQEHTITAGDMLTVGSVVFVFRIDGDPATIDTSAVQTNGSRPSTVDPTPSAVASREDELQPFTTSSDDSSVDFDFDDLTFDDDEDQPEL